MLKRKATIGAACCIAAIFFLATVMYFIVAFVSATFDVSKMEKEYKEVCAVVFFIFSFVTSAIIFGTIFQNNLKEGNDTDKTDA
jgi:energy-coupling factor transporter transmembrane protein EcfT